MYVYQMSWPIDMFGLMTNFKELYQARATKNPEEFDDLWNQEQLHFFLRRCLRELAEHETYWEGDIRGDNLYIGSVPCFDDSDSDYFIALKQNNNGSSYIISQIPFVHLQDNFVNTKHFKPVTQAMQDSINKILNDFAPLASKKSDGIGDIEYLNLRGV